MLLLHNSQTKQEAAVGANVSVVSQGAQKPLVWVEAGPAAALLFRRALPGCTACAQRGIFLPLCCLFWGASRWAEESGLTCSFIRDGSQPLRRGGGGSQSPSGPPEATAGGKRAHAGIH